MDVDKQPYYNPLNHEKSLTLLPPKFIGASVSKHERKLAAIRKPSAAQWIFVLPSTSAHLSSHRTATVAAAMLSKPRCSISSQTGTTEPTSHLSFPKAAARLASYRQP